LKNAELMMPVDDAVQSIVHSLEVHQMINNSVIVVHSDNGGDTCHAAGDSAPWGSNYPLRGRKMGYFEGGVRVPAFLYSPRLLDRAVGTEYAGLMHHVDWLATFVALAQGDSFKGVKDGAASDDIVRYGDGVNQWGAINGAGESPRTELVLDLPQNGSFTFARAEGSAELVEAWHGVAAVRVDDLKLIWSQNNETWFDAEVRTGTCPAYALASECELQDTLKSTCSWERYLFNVTADASEKHNLYNVPEYADALATLEAFVEDLVLSKPVFDDAYSGMSGVETRALKTTMSEAYYDAGGYVVPWGCAVME
jgi:hypothetical protein